MCTVSYIPLNGGFLLTSSRDEQISRPTQAPEPHKIEGTEIELFYPKDMKSGGTWIAVNPHENRAVCLLNGAFDNHQKKAKYRKSRGQILLESFLYPNAEIFHALINLTEIEPLTLLLIENSKQLIINELRWDGSRKYFRKIDVLQPQIWSSATLYDTQTRLERERWFRQWLQNNDWHDIAQFHTNRHGNDSENDILMSRTGGLQTVSISQIICENKILTLEYQDLSEKCELSEYC